jgi:hypothetical protein
MVVSDLVAMRPLPEEVRSSVEAYAGCIVGAALKQDCLRMIGEAGFRDVEVVEESRYAVGEDAPDEANPERRALRDVVSVKVRAWRR